MQLRNLLSAEVDVMIENISFFLEHISPENYPEYNFDDDIVINPYKGIKLLLLPVELLYELPIARCWDDIDRVCCKI